MMVRLAVLAVCFLGSCGPKDTGELERLKKQKTELDERVTASLDERNAILAKLGSIRAAEAVRASADLGAKTAELEESLVALRREKDQAERDAAQVAKLLEELKKR